MTRIDEECLEQAKSTCESMNQSAIQRRLSQVRQEHLEEQWQTLPPTAHRRRRIASRAFRRKAAKSCVQKTVHNSHTNIIVLFFHSQKSCYGISRNDAIS